MEGGGHNIEGLSTAFGYISGCVVSPPASLACLPAAALFGHLFSVPTAFRLWMDIGLTYNYACARTCVRGLGRADGCAGAVKPCPGAPVLTVVLMDAMTMTDLATVW